MDNNTFDPPLFVGSFFDAAEGNPSSSSSSSTADASEERYHVIGGQRIRIREYAFSPTNANFVWPNNDALAIWMLEKAALFHGKKILELGSATGALYCSLVLNGFDVTSSDAPDADISSNLGHNCEINRVPFRHIEHSWGDAWSDSNPLFDVIVASDILLYSRLYSSLVRSIRCILARTPAYEANGASYPFFLLSARRRVPEDGEFFEELRKAGLTWQDHGKRLYTITLRSAASQQQQQ